MDTLIHFEPKSDFEKLMFAKSRIKQLEEENKRLRMEVGFVESERDEALDKVAHTSKSGNARTGKEIRQFGIDLRAKDRELREKDRRIQKLQMEIIKLKNPDLCL